MTHKAKALALLSDGKPHTHSELYSLGIVWHSRKSDLERDGWLIEKWTENVAGETQYVYRLAGRALDGAGGRTDGRQCPPAPSSALEVEAGDGPPPGEKTREAEDGHSALAGARTSPASTSSALTAGEKGPRSDRGPSGFGRRHPAPAVSALNESGKRTGAPIPSLPPRHADALAAVTPGSLNAPTRTEDELFWLLERHGFEDADQLPAEIEGQLTLT